MTYALKKENVGNKIIITIEMEMTRSMLDNENMIQDSLNEAGMGLTGFALKQFDTDGSPLKFANVRYTSKGLALKEYETPFGKIRIERHVYQTYEGGAIFCPLDYEARIISSTTPKFANIVSSKYAKMAIPSVKDDLENCSHRKVSIDYISCISNSVAEIISEKKKIWVYDVDIAKKDVASIALSLDGAFINMKKEGWRQVMVGTVSLYDSKGERIYTSYTASSPEFKKHSFFEQFSKEIKNIIKKYPDAKITGIADGAKDNWTFLQKFTKDLCVDFYHVSEYIVKASNIIYSKDEKAAEAWLKKTLHNLKHLNGYHKFILSELKTFKLRKIKDKIRDEIEIIETYFINNGDKMIYAEHVENNYAIGSGVVEAACKVVVKQRLCCSGMRWTKDGSENILNLRSFLLTDGKWDQFWKKVDRYGIVA